MIKRKLQPGDIFLVILNLIPLAGVLFRGWDPKEIFIIYCLETVIIGGYNILKMLLIIIDRSGPKLQHETGNRPGGFFYVIFFIIHYGFFVLVQMTLFAAVSGLAGDGSLSPFSFIAKIPALLSPETKVLLWVFVGIYALHMTFDFILSGKYRSVPVKFQMFQPYLRIVVQQFVVICGSIFLQFGAGTIFMIVFILIKLSFELYVDFDSMLDKAAKFEEKQIKPHSGD